MRMRPPKGRAEGVVKFAIRPGGYQMTSARDGALDASAAALLTEALPLVGLDLRPCSRSLSGAERVFRHLRQRHRRRPSTPPRSWQPICQPPFPGGDPLPRHRELTGFRPQARRQWLCRTVHSGVERKSAVGAATSPPSRSFAWRLSRSSRPTTRAGSSSGMATGRRPRSALIRSARRSHGRLSEIGVSQLWTGTIPGLDTMSPATQPHCQVRAYRRVRGERPVIRAGRAKLSRRAEQGSKRRGGSRLYMLIRRLRPGFSRPTP